MEFITGSIFGGIFYDFVKYGAQVTAGFVQDKARENLKDWLADEQSTDKIVNCINAIGYNDGESKEVYCQRLANDSDLQHVLKNLSLNSSTHSETYTINQKANNSTGIKMVGRDSYEQNTTNNYYQNDAVTVATPKKS